MGKGFWLTVCLANHPLFSLCLRLYHHQKVRRNCVYSTDHQVWDAVCLWSVGLLELTPEQVLWEVVPPHQTVTPTVPYPEGTR